ncbi:hypothetical protein [Flammeovirga pectinis]|uniref:hypothetical protein n=1 Tax=Flammeovirga pectinis TaxID=2494373 RepID=UPI001F0CD32E|nr:hypothetical protein [Flammeovirga pectinis]
MKLKIILLLACVSFLVCSCSSNDDDTTTPTTLPTNDDDDQDDDATGNTDSDSTNVDTDTPDTDADADSDADDEVDLTVYQKIYGASDIYVDGDFVVIEVNGLPDHNSPYYQDTEWSDRYEDNTTQGFHLNPNRISSADRTMRIPLHPEEDPNHEDTALGIMELPLMV